MTVDSKFEEILPEDREQLRNVVLYVVTNALVYLSAPVLYVGITQASLCNALGASDLYANLPSSAFFWSMVTPVFIAWRFHSIAALKPVLVGGYGVCALAGTIVVVALVCPAPLWLRLTSVVVYGGLIGAALSVTNAYSWEVVRRGISLPRRGLAFSLTFGLGPFLAVVGSLIAQLILAGKVDLPIYDSATGFVFHTYNPGRILFPGNFALLFGLSVPPMGLAALLAGYYVIPPAMTSDLSRPSFWEGLRVGVHNFRHDRVLLAAMIAYVLIDGGFTITNNLSIYTTQILGKAAQDYAGYQNAARFSFKMISGLFLGLLLARTSAKACMLATGVFCLLGTMWPLIAPSSVFLLCFGLMGAGELYGHYYPNYIMQRAHVDRVRHDMALLQLFSLVTSLAPVLFGCISDGFGLPTSFVVAGAVVAASLLIVLIFLPSQTMTLPTAAAS